MLAVIWMVRGVAVWVGGTALPELLLVEELLLLELELFTGGP